MTTLSSIFFCISLILAVLLGSQTRSWSWGPSLLFLALSLASAMPAIFRSRKSIQPGLLILSIVTSTWYLLRAYASPVGELAIADILLTLSSIGSFIAVRMFSIEKRSEKIFLWTLAGLVLGSAVVIYKQLQEPSFTPILGNRPVTLPSGFFGHYNDGANFLIATSLLLGSAAFFSTSSKLTKLVWGVTAIIGLLAIYFTRSRGAILATGIATAVFFISVLLLGKTRNRRWFAPAVIAAPILTLIALGFVYLGWTNAQEIRFETDIDKLMDGNIRLFLYGISISCISTHPWFGGGSRSFSWECNQFWINQDHGQGSHRLEYVHNELLQAATDYGLIGAVLLVLLISWSLVLFLIYSCSDNGTASDSDSVRVGPAAALVGMLLQSNFSFVFHLLPGPLLLGVCLARITTPNSEPVITRLDGTKKACVILITTIVCALAFTYGWKGTRVTFSVWPAFFTNGVSDAQKLSALSEGIRLWPQASLYRERARLSHRSVREESIISNLNDLSVSNTIRDYSQAASLNPYEPNSIINLANLLSVTGKDQEAESNFRRAIYLQGGMEVGYKSHLLLAEHYVRKGRRMLKEAANEKALETYLLANNQLAAIEKETPWVINEPRGIALHLSVLSELGMAYERLGDLESALTYFDQASAMVGGSSSHYRVGQLIGTLAKTAWSERRPSEALTRFQEARQRIELAAELPAGVTPEMKAEYVTFLDHSIQYLIDAKVEPLKKLEE